MDNENCYECCCNGCVADCPCHCSEVGCMGVVRDCKDVKEQD